MSGENNSNDEYDDQSRGEQPQGGQPQGGQPPQGQPQGGQPPQGQPQGGQPPQGQPQGGQPPQGQPQGGQPPQGQPQGGQPSQGGQAYGQYQQGPGIVDKLQYPANKEHIIGAVILYAVVGVGGLIGPLILSNLGSGTSGAAASAIGNAFATLALASGVLLPVFLGREASLLDTDDNTVMAVSAVSNGVGYLVAGILAVIGLSSASSGRFGGQLGIGDYFLGLIVGVIIVALLGAVAGFAARRFRL